MESPSNDDGIVHLIRTSPGKEKAVLVKRGSTVDIDIAISGCGSENSYTTFPRQCPFLQAQLLVRGSFILVITAMCIVHSIYAFLYQGLGKYLPSVDSDICLSLESRFFVFVCFE